MGLRRGGMGISVVKWSVKYVDLKNQTNFPLSHGMLLDNVDTTSVTLLQAELINGNDGC